LPRARKARTLVEVKDIANKATALKEYGRLAKDRRLEIDAGELRFRAVRRLGEMLAAVKATVGLNAGNAGKGRPKIGGSDSEPTNEIAPDTAEENAPTLAEIGIDKKLSSRTQKLAAISERAFESRVVAWREHAEPAPSGSASTSCARATSASGALRAKRRSPKRSPQAIWTCRKRNTA